MRIVSRSTRAVQSVLFVSALAVVLAFGWAGVASAAAVAPSTSISVSGGTAGDNGWYKTAAPLVTLTADQVGVMTRYRWDTDAAPFSTYAGSFTAPEGAHTLYYYSSNGALNEKPHKSLSFKVDFTTTAPVLTMPLGTDLAPAHVAGVIDVQASATDAVSGVQYVSFFAHAWNGVAYDSVGAQIGGNQSLPMTGSTYGVTWDTRLVTDNRYQLEAQTRDVAGNVLSSSYQYVATDNTAPVATLATPPASAPIHGAGYAVMGTATDAGLSSWKLEKRRLPSGVFVPIANGTSPVTDRTFATIDTTAGYPDGFYEFRLTVADTAGNTANTLRTDVAVDNTGPAVTSASSAGFHWVDVVFSEAIDPAAVLSSYFTIPGLTISGAVLQSDKRTVQLTTSDQVTGTDNYTVTVAHPAPTITDLIGNVLGTPNAAVFSGTTTLPAPSPPSGVQAYSGNGRNDISWAAGTEVFLGGYNVYRDTSLAGPFATKVNSALIPTGTTSLSDGGYGGVDVYYYRVTAVNTTGGESAKSAAVAAGVVRMSAVVGPSGGALSSSTGGARLVVPAGALTGDTEIKISEGAKPVDRPTLKFFSPTYRLLPAGQKFGANVALTVAETTPGPSEPGAKLFYYDSGSSTWVEAEGGSSVDAAGHTVTGRANHFTDFAVGVMNATPPAVLPQVDPPDDASGVVVTTRVAIPFTLPMDPNAADWTRFQIRKAGTAINIGPPVLSADRKTVYLYPKRMLDIKTSYQVFVSGTALGENGAELGADFTSTFTTAATGVSPHGSYDKATNLCANCHAVHGAATASTGGGKLFTEPTEKQVCYTCHDGTGSAYDVRTGANSTLHAWDFGEATANSTLNVSYHTVPTASSLSGSTTMQCSNCHSAHGIATSGSAFLVVKPLDDPGLKGATKVVSGNDYCFTCHTSAANAAGYNTLPSAKKYIGNTIWASSTGFDHQADYSAAGKGHNNPAGVGFTSGSEWVPTVAGIVCKACHSEHGSSNGKLIAEKVNNTDVTFDSASAIGYNTTYNPFCETCHQGAGLGGVYWPSASTYNASGHGASIETRTLAYAPNDASASMTLQVKLCKQCHEPHGAGDTNGPYLNLTRYFEEGVCYTCHSGKAGSPAGAKNVASVFAGTSKHDLALSSTGARKHDQDAEYAAALNPNPRLSGANRHVECADCHNMHQSDASPRLAGTNLASGALKGVWGVDASAGVAWSAPSGWTWTKKNPVTAEYQVCLKCHSAAAYGSTPPDASPNPTSGTSYWPIGKYTDQALEFNPNNPSYHAVWGGSKASIYGTYDASAGWTAASSMYCSDCHRPDTVTTPSVGGAHASNTPFMLGGYSTPAASRYVTGHGPTEYASQAARDADFALCFQCHNPGGASSGFAKETVNLHNLSEHTLRACTVCHVAVPHGAPRPRLIVLTTDAAPYNDGSAMITAITFSPDKTYEKDSCATTSGCH